MINRPQANITPVWVSTRRRLVSAAVMASVWRCRIIGIETTLMLKISPAKIAPTAAQAAMKGTLSGDSKAGSEPLKSGMPSKLTANSTSVTRPQSSSSTRSTKPKMASCPVRVSKANSESAKPGLSPCSSRWLTRYRPRQRKGPISRKPADSAIMYAGAC